ncbi:MAG: TonB family protein [Bacteroidales bacterium]|nr:TonB family protein [Bacteroidales bacterium]
MKLKKSKKANLEKFRTIFFQAGMILTLSAIFVAFEWKSSVEFEPLTIISSGYEEMEIVMPRTKHKEEIVKPPVPVETFTIEKDDYIIEDEPEFMETDVDWNDPMPDIVIEDDDPEVIDEPLVFAQFMPTFQGKDGSYFRNYITECVKFPEDAIINSISGKVYISFVIDKDGSVTNVEVLRGVHEVVDNAVVEVIKNSPRWEPGINEGNYVRVKYAIAIAFELQ